MTRRRFAVITFDLDDTLWDVRPVLEQAEREVAAWVAGHCPDALAHIDHAALMRLRLQLLAERPELQHRISDLRIEAMAQAFAMSGQDAARARQLAQEAFEVFIAARHRVHPFAAVDTTLERLAQDYVIGALSNGNANIFRIPLGRHFRFAFSAEQLGSSKPDPRHFEAACAHARVAAADVLHIGDHPEQDVIAAQDAGMAALWFDRTGSGWQGARAPLASFSDFGELPDVIAGLERARGD